MKIIANELSGFDSFVRQPGAAAPALVARNAERLDAAICSLIDHARFSVARFGERTIMTTAGVVTYRRRCYYDSFGKRYIWPAGSVLGAPPRAKVSTELKRALIEDGLIA